MQQLETIPELLYEPEDNGILWIRLNRPERLNAIPGGAQRNGMLAKVGEYMRAGDDDPNVRVMVLTGVGRGFCAGTDTRDRLPDEQLADTFLGNRRGEGVDAAREEFLYGVTKLIQDVSRVRKPTIAMLNGPAAGYGMDLALQCDIRYGCENTRFLTYQQVGQIVQNGGSYWLPRLVGLGRALEFAYTGVLDAQRAYEWGLLNRLVPSEDLESAVRELCGQIVASPPIPQWIHKRVMRAALDTSPETVALLTSNAASILRNSDDSREAIAARSEGRSPRFIGR